MDAMNHGGNLNLNNNPDIFQIRWAIVARCSNNVFTLSIGLYSAIIDSLKQDESMKVPEKTNDFNSVLYLGAVFGVLLSIFTSSYKKSRLLYLNAAILTSLIGWIYMWFASVYSSLIAGRIIVGFAMGIHSVAFYFYLYEYIFVETRFIIRNISLRSKASDFFKEILFILLIGWFLSWRNVILVGILYHVHALLCLWTAPESPYILHRYGEEIRSRAAFSQLVGRFSDETNHYYEMMRNDVELAMEMESAGTSTDIPLLLKASAIFILQELTGITCYYCYSTTIIEEKFFNLFAAFIILNGWQIIKQFNLRTADFRSLLPLSSKYMGHGFLLMGSILIFHHHYDAGYIVLFMKMLALQFYFLSYTIGWICVPHALLENDNPYHETIKIVAPALLCKFLGTFFLIKDFEPFSISTSFYYSFHCLFLRFGFSFIPNLYIL